MPVAHRFGARSQGLRFLHDPLQKVSGIPDENKDTRYARVESSRARVRGHDNEKVPRVCLFVSNPKEARGLGLSGVSECRSVAQGLFALPASRRDSATVL